MPFEPDERVPYPEDLVYIDAAEADTGVPRSIIRKWASRGRIRRYPGDGRSFGHGHFQRTRYDIVAVRELAATYEPMPQRAPKHRPGRAPSVAV